MNVHRIKLLFAKKSYLVSLAVTNLILVSDLASQTMLYNYSFGTDLEGWQSVGISSADPSKSANAVWIWTDECRSVGAFAQGVELVSESGGGCVLFDSDFLDTGGGGLGTGNAPAPHRGELISPLLNFSAAPEVYISFHQYYRYFSKDGISDFNTPASKILISSDNGLTWDSINVNGDIRPNQSTPTNDLEFVDISSFAAGHPSVLVKFVWEGYLYFWIVDDIKFYDTKGVDLGILAYTLPDNFATPAFIFNQDTVDCEVKIVNESDIQATNVQAEVVIMDQTGTTLFSDVSIIPQLAAGEEMIVDFGNHFIPSSLSNGNYQIQYNVSAVDTDANQSNNMRTTPFQLTSDRFQKTMGGTGIGFTGQTGPGTYEDFSFGNIYQIPYGSDPSVLNSVTFECFSTSGLLEGKTVNTSIIEFPEEIKISEGAILDLTGGFPSFDLTISLDEMIAMGWEIAAKAYTFTAEDGSGGDFSADFTEMQPVVLMPGRIYFVVANYSGDANMIAQEVSDNFPLHQATTLSYFPSFGRWLLLGTGGRSYARNIAAIDIDVTRIASPGSVCPTAHVLISNGIYGSIGPTGGDGCHNCSNASHANWYYFDAPANGTLHVNSCLFGVNTRLFAYSGSCEALSPITSGDDECLLTNSGANLATSISFSATASTRYYFEWDDRWSTDPFQFEFLFIPDVGNCTVSNDGDTGEGSLRNAIDCANPGDTVFISSLLMGDSICLETGKIVIDKDLTILGHPQYMIPIDGSVSSQSIEIATGVSVILQNVDLIVNPSSGMNAIDNFGDLSLKDVRIEYLSTSAGGIFSNEGTVVMDPEVEIVQVE